jgi:hypothetical protein
LWVIFSRNLHGCGDLGFVGQVVCVVQGIEHVHQFPGLVVEVFRMSGIEVADGGKELGGVHGQV